MITKEEARIKNEEMDKKSGLFDLHALGHKGKGYRGWIADNIPSTDGHEVAVFKVLRHALPEATIEIVQNGRPTILLAAESLRTGINPVHFIVVPMTGIDPESSKEYVALGGKIIAATGNVGNGGTSEFSPWPHIIDIGGIFETTMDKASYSATAVTTDYVTTVPYIEGDGGYFQPTGTSFADPYGTGCIIAQEQYLRSVGYMGDVMTVIKKKAIDMGVPGPDNRYGGGVLKVGTVDWIDVPIDTNTIIKSGKTINVKQGGIIHKVTKNVNGKPVTETYTMVPLRVLAELLGKEVGWVQPQGTKGIARIF